MNSVDWEIDFYSRPVIEEDGKKRWELLLCATPGNNGGEIFRWQMICPATSVNSAWLGKALQEAIRAAEISGHPMPRRLRCWRGSMRTMIQRAAAQLDLEVVVSRRAYALREWLAQREREVYPLEPGFIRSPLSSSVTTTYPPSVPLPEAVRGDAWGWASLQVSALIGAADWDFGFGGLVPVPPDLDRTTLVPGLRLFSRSRSLALAAWLGSLEPVSLVVEGVQLILEAGFDDRWLVTDLDPDKVEATQHALAASRTQAAGLQFIAVQPDANATELAGFWMLRDLPSS